MPRILITGMAGTGKTAVIRALADRGHEAHDLDSPDWSEWTAAAPWDDLTPAPGKDWVWREDRVRALLSRPLAGPRFVGGCAENMGLFAGQIDRKILLSAPVPVLMARLAARAPGEYGHSVADRRKVARLVVTVEPLLRARAYVEIDTRQALDAVVDDIEKLAL